MVAERDTGVREALERLFHFDGQLARVIDVHAHPEGMIFLQHRAQLGRDALRQENRDPRADAEKLDVRDGAQAFQNSFEFVVAENQGVAAGEEDIPDLGVLFKITERLLEIGVQFLFAHAADDAASGAIPAVARATVRHEKQDAIRIAMDQPRHRHVRIFAARIHHVVGRSPGFLDPGDDLAADRVLRIITRDQVEKVRRDGQSELVAREQNAAAFFIRKFEVLLELGQGCDPVFELPFPIVPEFRRDPGPIAGRVRDELFSIHFPWGKSEHF